MLQFRINGEREYVGHSLTESLYQEAGIGFGEVPLDRVQAFFVGRRDRLQPSDIVTDYEKELSRIAYWLHMAAKRGATVVSVSQESTLNESVAPVDPRQQNDAWPGCWVTIVELEFQHVMRDPAAPTDLTRLGPRPDQLHEGLNTPATSVTSNGLLLWLPDGSVVQSDWCCDEMVFTRRDGKGKLGLSQVRAWSALPQPIADA